MEEENALQATHSVAALPAAEEKFAGQSVQKACPAEAVKFSTGQDRQGPPAGPAAPALQTQAAPARLDAGEEDSDGQV